MSIHAMGIQSADSVSFGFRRDTAAAASSKPIPQNTFTLIVNPQTGQPQIIYAGQPPADEFNGKTGKAIDPKTAAARRQAAKIKERQGDLSTTGLKPGDMKPVGALRGDSSLEESDDPDEGGSASSGGGAVHFGGGDEGYADMSDSGATADYGDGSE